MSNSLDEGSETGQLDLKRFFRYWREVQKHVFA